MSLFSISKLKNCRYQRSRLGTGLSISKFRLFDIEHNDSSIMIRYRALTSYTISKAFFTFDVEYKSFNIAQLNIGIDIVYDVAFIQWHSLRSGSSRCPGGFTSAAKSLSAAATSPGFLHPLLAEFHSLIHRDLTRKRPSIAPHPHVDFKQPAPSPVLVCRRLRQLPLMRFQIFTINLAPVNPSLGKSPQGTC
jgi:hypothetical protein